MRGGVYSTNLEDLMGPREDASRSSSLDRVRRLAPALYALAAAVLIALVVFELSRDDVDVPPSPRAPAAKVSLRRRHPRPPLRRRGKGSRWG